MELNQLYNPKKITGFLHKNGKYYETCENTGVQIYYKDKEESQITKIEFWEKLEDGRLLKIIGFTSKSIIATYN